MSFIKISEKLGAGFMGMEAPRTPFWAVLKGDPFWLKTQKL
jgi:hypothetical protein